jgi:hypothetical protein
MRRRGRARRYGELPIQMFLLVTERASFARYAELNSRAFLHHYGLSLQGWQSCLSAVPIRVSIGRSSSCCRWRTYAM